MALKAMAIKSVAIRSTLILGYITGSVGLLQVTKKILSLWSIIKNCGVKAGHLRKPVMDRGTFRVMSTLARDLR
jgi:hypothetical protein